MPSLIHKYFIFSVVGSIVYSYFAFREKQTNTEVLPSKLKKIHSRV